MSFEILAAYYTDLYPTRSSSTVQERALEFPVYPISTMPFRPKKSRSKDWRQRRAKKIKPLYSRRVTSVVSINTSTKEVGHSTREKNPGFFTDSLKFSKQRGQYKRRRKRVQATPNAFAQLRSRLNKEASSFEYQHFRIGQHVTAYLPFSFRRI